MTIKSLHIISFGGLRNRDISLDKGLNLISGENESGKTSVAMFIKFIFYGLSAKSRGGIPSERKRFVNAATGQAAGYIMLLTDDGKKYRIERALLTSTNMPPRERVRIIDVESGEIIMGENPGEYFFGISEEVFTDTCFVSQSGAIKPDILGSSSGSTKNAVENLLSSANENVDIQKATKKLDSIRRELFHRNKNGGEIKELREKRSAIALELEEVTKKSAELLSVSTSLEDTRKHIETLEASKEKYDKIFSSLDKLSLKKKIDTRAEAKDQISFLEKSVEDLDNSPIGDGFADALAESERDIRAYDELCAAYDEKLSSPRMPEAEKVDVDPEKVIEAVRQTDSSSRVYFSVAIALLIFGIIGFATVLLLFYFNTGTYTLPLIMTFALTCLGIIFVLQYAKMNRKLNMLLEEWEAVSPDEIETAVYDKLNSMGIDPAREPDISTMESNLETARLRFDAASDRISSMAKMANIEESEDIYDTIDLLHSVSEKVGEERAQMISKLENLRGRIQVLDEQLSDVDIENAEIEANDAVSTPEGMLSSSLDSDGIKNLSKERDFTENALRASMKRKSELESRILEIGKLSSDPEVLATKLEYLDGIIEELSLKHDACELAIKALTDAGAAMRSEVIPDIAKKASAIIAKATNGAHSTLTLDSSFSAGLTSENRAITSELFSKGTSDLSYIALRISLAEELFKDEAPIMVFDETFAHIDTSRTEAMLKMLCDNQYLVFTCKTDEVTLSEKVGANIIKL